MTMTVFKYMHTVEEQLMLRDACIL